MDVDVGREEERGRRGRRGSGRWRRRWGGRREATFGVVVVGGWHADGVAVFVCVCVLCVSW